MPGNRSLVEEPNSGGRFNAKGTPALYMSLSVMTALREANQVGNFRRARRGLPCR
jgi:RES domain-containing protein